MHSTKSILVGTTLVLATMIAALPTYYAGLLALAGIHAIVCLGLSFLLAAGQLSLGHAAFLGTGAYAAAILTRDAGWPPLLALAAAVAGCAALAYLLGHLTLRLRGHYLPLATLAWGMAIHVCFGAATGVTGGASGLPDIPAFSLHGAVLGTRAMTALTWGVVALSFLAFCRIHRGRIGRAAAAIKSNPTMASAFGVDVAAVKIRIFVLSAAMTALAGGLYAFYMQFLSPGSFSVGASFNLLIMVVLGGVLHPLGALLGAIAFTGLEIGAQYLVASLLDLPGQMESMLFGAILIAALLRWPNGLMTWVRVPRSAAAPAMEGHAVSPAGADRLPARALRVEAVEKHFGGLRALQGVSIEIGAARITGLIGPNGAGKSTLFNVMTAVLPATRGRITLGGEPLARTSAQVVRQGVARTFQHVQLVAELSVLENVMLGGYIHGRAGLLAAALGRDRAEERALAAAAHAALAQVGLAAEAGRPVAELTLGSQRLVEVARALMAHPRVLLLDEPAAGLREPEKRALVALMRRLRDERGMAILLVEHDMDLVMGCVDYLFVLNYGELLSQGASAEVQRDPAVVAAYLGADA